MTQASSPPTPDLERIYLHPPCEHADLGDDGRHWCEDIIQCDECDMPATEYVRADLLDALTKERDDLKNALEIIADWDKAPITGEHQAALIDIIRSICSCARRALTGKD